MKAGKRLPTKRAAGDKMGKDNAGAGEDDAVVFFVIVFVENNDIEIPLSMSAEAVATSVVVDVVIVVVVVHILDGQRNCPATSKEEEDEGNE